MQQYKSNRELKAMAREVLLGKYNVTAVALLVLMAVSMLCSVVITLVSNPFTRTGILLNYLMLFIMMLGMSIFNVGLCLLFLNIARNRPYQITDIFLGFRHADKAILVYLISFGISIVFMIPYIVCMVLAIVNRNLSYYLPAAILGILGTIAAYAVCLNFSFVYQLFADYPQLSAIDLYKKSMELMRGHKKRLFVLTLSFLGWLLPGILSCGIAFLWITPYIQASTAYFYLDVTGELSPGRPEVVLTPPSDTFYTSF